MRFFSWTLIAVKVVPFVPLRQPVWAPPLPDLSNLTVATSKTGVMAGEVGGCFAGGAAVWAHAAPASKAAARHGPPRKDRCWPLCSIMLLSLHCSLFRARFR